MDKVLWKSQYREQRIKQKPIVLKDIPGYEGLYAVTPDGKIWSHPKHGRKGGWMCPHKQKDGYIKILFSVNKVRKTLKVHRLVGMVYLRKVEGKIS